MLRTRSAAIRIALAAGLLASFGGCQFWRNFSTYFNTLYLAQAHLDAYEEQMNAQPQAASSAAVAALGHRWLDEEYEMRQLAIKSGESSKIEGSFLRTKPTPRGSGSSVHLDSAIILGSKILANKNATKYVEDALYIVGKAQFYKNDFAGSKRKFLELLTHYPNTKYGSAVQMFLARSMLASGALDTAQTALTNAVTAAEGEHDQHTLGDAHRTLAEIIYARNPDSLAAIAHELSAAEGYYQGDESARLAYEAGAVEFLAGEWDSASASFERTVVHTTDANFEGEARIGHALALRRLGKFDEAKAELALVSEKTKFSNEWPASKYELALTTDLQARTAVHDDLRSAAYKTDRYPGVRDAYFTVDTTFKTVSQVILSRSRFREAEILRGTGEFDSAARYAVPLIGTKDFSSLRMNDYVSARMRALAQFARLRNDLATLDTLEHQLKLAREGVDLTKTADQTIHSEAVRQVLGTRWRPDQQVVMTPEEQAQVPKIESQLRRERGVLFAFQKLGIKDTARFADSVHYSMARDHHEIGLSYENFGEIATARDEYKTALGYHYVIADTSKELFNGLVVYTWLQLEASEKNIPVRDSLLRVLTTYYGQTFYTRQAMALYGGPKDMNSPGEVAYRLAYGSLRHDGIEPAKPQFLSVVSDYSKEDVAPRSLFAIGVSFEEQSKFDSAVVYYRRVLLEYPYSPYADELRPRLADAVQSRPMQTARRVEPTQIKSDAEKEQEEADRARREREQQLKDQTDPSKRGAQPPDTGVPDASQHPTPDTPPSGPDSNPPLPGNTPSSPFDRPSTPVKR